MHDTLEGLEIELHEMEATSAAAAEALAGPPEMLPVGLRTALASLHGSANKLLATRLDAIVTGDLTTGREAARAKRKVLVAAAEALIERTEEQIRQIDRRKAGGAPDSDDAVAAPVPLPPAEAREFGSGTAPSQL